MPLSLISVIRFIRGLKMGQGRKTHYLYIRAYARVSFLRQTRQVRHGILLDIMVLGTVLPLRTAVLPLRIRVLALRIAVLRGKTPVLIGETERGGEERRGTCH